MIYYISKIFNGHLRTERMTKKRTSDKDKRSHANIRKRLNRIKWI